MRSYSLLSWFGNITWLIFAHQEKCLLMRPIAHYPGQRFCGCLAVLLLSTASLAPEAAPNAVEYCGLQGFVFKSMEGLVLYHYWPNRD